ncbi:hypothetical protein FJK98_02460 [Micromonospora sp. HM134]|uniref:hypothetical protein n=1 Tax=Micromonospora sp. HM134 TaxID=2583243 RepID=UPI001198CB2B|nr:hypothetical protein [Micromonospora sp. HM134]QDY06164.1 hypothetical protein FJK98_02460 [Micromonospora sp. HM134]
MDMEMDVSGDRELAVALNRAQSRSVPEVEKVVAKGSLNIKRDAARRVSGLKHAPAYPAAIGYDLYHGLTTVRSEIGPDKEKRQGALGNILEHGTRNNAPIPHLGPAMDAEEPRYVQALEDLAQDLLED